MLTSFRVRHFKSLADVELRLRDLTLLIGWNASGKSNVLEALGLLCWTARTPRLTDLPHAMKSGQVRIRGNVDDLRPIHGPERAIVLSCEVGPNVADYFDSFTTGRVKGHALGGLALEIGMRIEVGDVRVEWETLRAPDIEALNFRTPLYTAKLPRSDARLLDATFQNFRRATKPTVQCTPDQPCFAQLTSPARFPAGYEEAREVIPFAARRVAAVLAAVHFLDPDPRAMRGYAYRDDPELHENGGNVSAVLSHLKDQQRLHEVMAFVEDLPESSLKGISFLETPRNEVMAVLHESVGGREVEVPAALMSDGTLRVLAVAAALLSAKEGSLVVIEEIDNGVHPSRAQGLLHTIFDTARRRNLRVLITTHNPALQDALPEEVLPDVTLAYRDPASGNTRLTRLGDLEAFPQMVAAGPLGQLVTRQSFEKMVKGPHASPDTDWLFGPRRGNEPDV